LATQFKEAIPHTRGPQDISLFREAAPSVVLIVAKDKLGSGSLLQDNVILTNLHVVKENQEVAIIFKPMNPNGKATADEVVIADVIKIDVQRDLALLRPRSLPNRTVRPLQISSQDIEVGADVRAIGHRDPNTDTHQSRQLRGPPSGGFRHVRSGKPIFEGRNLKNTAFLRVISLRCDDKADITIVVPDDKAQGPGGLEAPRQA
jgi:trypsin-like peptidase